jgi:isopentenyl diphosphate isomerase/L-lactate dehydrogenase-like FMN-dependent dehydrogenase
VLGKEIALPVIISPVGVQAVHPDGEVAVARAAAAAGTAVGPSSFASTPIEDVAAANGQTFIQMYWVGGRDRILQRAERAKQSGARALITGDRGTANRYAAAHQLTLSSESPPR